MSAVQHLGEALTDPRSRARPSRCPASPTPRAATPITRSLSERRADTIKRYLIDNYHVSAGDLITAGYGKTHLKDAANPDSAVNRRVQVINTEVQNTAQK